ncbi:MAG: ABC transporter permease [Gammaproteobacteria bacterium]|nr:ABC transporter permease [Gammaproteobacteria bacterium]
MDVSHHSYSPWLVFLSLWRHRELVWQLTQRDVVGRYRGSFMGLLWSFIHPLVMLAVYTTVFGVILQTKWPGIDDSLDFALILFAGLIIYNFFSECLNRAPLLILGHPNYVKKVIFPLEIFPWVAVGSALFHTGVSVIAWLIFYFAVHGMIDWTVIFLPLVFLPLILVALGCCWFLSSAGVFVRDVGQTVSLITLILLFMSPVFYSINGVPPGLRAVLLMNPLTFIMEQARAVLIWEQWPDFGGLAVYAAVSLVAAWLGLAWFQKTRDGFADVI